MQQRNSHAGTCRRHVLGVIGATAFVSVGATAVTAQSVVPDFPITEIGPEYDPNNPTIVVIDAGGTLTSTAQDRISYLQYAAGVEGGVQTILEDLYPELAAIANLSVLRAEGSSLGYSAGVTSESLLQCFPHHRCTARKT